jgi:hypothetical protein
MLSLIKKMFGIAKEKIQIYDETDARNFNSSVIAGQITREDLTEDDFLTFHPIEKIDQGSTDFCVGCGKAYAKEATEGMPMSWSGAFALCMKQMGYITDWGTSILQMMKAGKNHGVPERSIWPYRADKGRNWNADWKNMPDSVITDAKFHRDQSYFEVDVPWGWDEFDAFRAHLNKFKNKKIVIQSAVDKHEVTLCGQKKIDGEIKLVGIDSYGERSIKYRIGQSINGWRYFSRAEANLLATGYFSFDIDRTLAELLNEYDGKAVKIQSSPDCFVVKNGQRHNLQNEFVALAHGCLMYDPNNVYTIAEEELKRIPEGAPAKFREGQNWQLVQRILEKTNNQAIIDQLK